MRRLVIAVCCAGALSLAALFFSLPARADLFGFGDASLLQQQVLQFLQDWRIHIIDDTKNGTRNKTLKEMRTALQDQANSIRAITRMFNDESTLAKYYHSYTDMLLVQNDFAEMAAPFMYCDNVAVASLASQLNRSLSAVSAEVIRGSLDQLAGFTKNVMKVDSRDKSQASAYETSRLIEDRLGDAYGYMNDLSLQYQDILVGAVYDDLIAKNRRATSSMNFANFN
jgi:hypothetical protein